MSKVNYIKSLDGIRFLAVSLVLADHWSGDKLSPASYLGVCMFFVLSGFLITRILLKAKEKDREENRGHGFSLKQFYIRRTIRIFPLYYLTLFILILLGVSPVREKLFWLATYMSNNYFAYFSTWFGSVDHLWSLAVEEQFYLFFPFVVLFFPLKWLPKTFGFFVIFAVLLRAFFYFKGASWVAPYVLMPTCLDAFGLGALLAFISYFQIEKFLSLFKSYWVIAFGLIVYTLTVFWLRGVSDGHNYVSTIFLRLAESIISVTILGFLVAQKNTAFHRFFEWQPFVYIGKISYGIYIFHNFVFSVYHPIPWSPMVKLVHKMEQSGNIILSSETMKIIVLYAFTVLLASCSWYLFEKPINKLKNKFGY